MSVINQQVKVLGKVKSASEIEGLKSRWATSPNWKLEEEVGFSSYKHELRAYRKWNERSFRVANEWSVDVNKGRTLLELTEAEGDSIDAIHNHVECVEAVLEIKEVNVGFEQWIEELSSCESIINELQDRSVQASPENKPKSAVWRLVSKLSRQDSNDNDDCFTKIREERNADEIAELKANWILCPSWIIEETHGFERHKEELAKFSSKFRSRHPRKELKRLRSQATTYHVDDRLGDFLNSVLLTKSELQAKIKNYISFTCPNIGIYDGGVEINRAINRYIETQVAITDLTGEASEFPRFTGVTFGNEQMYSGSSV